MSVMPRLACLLVLAFAAFAAHAQEAYRPLEQRLSAEQMRATGLDRLSAEQLALLNRLLREEQSVQAQAVRAEARAEAEQERSRGGVFKRDREPIVSKIQGTFQGWSAGTRFTLANGQTWRVIDTPEYYVPKSKAVDGPAVAITPGLLGGWYLQVEGQGPRAKVQEVR